MKAESILSDHPVWTLQTDLTQNLMQMSECPFLSVSSQLHP